MAEEKAAAPSMMLGEAAATIGLAPHVNDITDEWLAKLYEAAKHLHHPADDLVRVLITDIHHLRAPVPMIIYCPMCRARHIDRGEFATKAHHTHACQGCGFTWRPAVVATVGVDFLPGFRDVQTPRVGPEGQCEFVVLQEVAVGRSWSRGMYCGEPAYGSLDGVAPLCPKHGGPPAPPGGEP